MRKSPALSILLSLLFVFGVSIHAAGDCQGAEAETVLTLEEAIELALAKNPLLRAYGWEAGAMEAGAEQAGAFANPELAAEFENAWGTGSMAGTNGAETTLLLNQEIRTWGKRSKTRKLATIEAGISRLELEAIRRETISVTEGLFIDLLAAQRGAELAGEMTALSGQLLDTVRERVESGKVAPLEERKASVSYSMSRVELDRVKRGLEVARMRLVSMWGETEATFVAAAGDLGEITPPPSLDSLDNLISGNPGLMMAEKAVERQEAVLSLEKAMRIPDVVLSGGTRWFEETGERALVFGLSLPLPLFNRNGSAVRQARYRINKAVEERRAVESDLRTLIAGTYEEMQAAYKGSVAFSEDVFPAARNAFEIAGEGYREGKWGLLEVLDARRTLIEAGKEQIGILTSYHKALSRLGELTGRRLLWRTAREDQEKGGRS